MSSLDKYLGLATHDLGVCCAENLDAYAGLLMQPVLIDPGRLGCSKYPASDAMQTAVLFFWFPSITRASRHSGYEQQ